MGPTGATVGLVSHMAYNVFAFRPSFPSIESGRQFHTQEALGFLLFWGKSGPFRVYNGAHKTFGFFESHVLEFWLNFGSPGVLVGVHGLNQFFVFYRRVLDLNSAETSTIGFVIFEKISGEREGIPHALTFQVTGSDVGIGFAKSAYEITFGKVFVSLKELQQLDSNYS